MSEKHPKKKRAGKVTAGYLERAALHYLGRFASTQENLRKVLERKVRRRNEDGAAPTEEQVGWIADVVAKCVRYGYVNDETYASARAESLLRKGKPTRQIVQDLRFKGVSADVATETVDGLGDDEADISADRQAAAAYVRRRRFGPYRREVRDTDGKREKEIASMMRAGFSYGLSVQTLDATLEDIEDILP
ncbi:regulatory protein RecX [Kordiimonas gwangyangensis]|uniref:regulatory protein RecX n=1 Tax=Kordiimonas gwangyangensis TaxID=288022 RepID=UPI00035E49F5|nr:RecX family transcriptional regulator [Kordiimonas gwangyangensis]